jgi:hypothetical protein
VVVVVVVLVGVVAVVVVLVGVVVVVVVLVGVVAVVVVLVGVVVVVVVWVGVVVVVVGRETTSQVFTDVAPTVVVDLPASQSVHVAAPKTVLYFPVPHAMHVPPLGPVYPSLHLQRSTSGEPTYSVLPFRQSMQGPDPIVDLYLPIPQLRQFGAIPVLPKAHIHDDASVCPVSCVVVRTGQPLHAAEPIVDLYSPRGHGVHVPPSGPEVPAGHPGRETTSQVFADVAPTVVVDLPASQLVHVAVPTIVLYFPVPHAMQVPPLGPVYPSLHLQRSTSGEPGHSVLPFRQSMQGPDPIVDLYLPIPQFRQFGAIPVVPKAHIHDDVSVCPVSCVVVETGQPLQSAEPIVDLYSPRSHGVHVPPSGPEVPAGH